MEEGSVAGEQPLASQPHQPVASTAALANHQPTHLQQPTVPVEQPVASSRQQPIFVSEPVQLLHPSTQQPLAVCCAGVVKEAPSSCCGSSEPASHPPRCTAPCCSCPKLCCQVPYSTMQQVSTVQLLFFCFF